MNELKKFADRGYVVKETGPVYYTTDIEKTVEWFEEILGWYYEIDECNSEGKGVYGCVYNIPKEIEILHIAPFTGIHMFYGEPKSDVVAFMQIQGIDALYKYVKDKGWKNISEVQVQPWGSKMCDITTPDGCILKFFE